MHIHNIQVNNKVRVLLTIKSLDVEAHGWEWLDREDQ